MNLPLAHPKGTSENWPEEHRYCGNKQNGKQRKSWVTYGTTCKEQSARLPTLWLENSVEF